MEYVMSAIDRLSTPLLTVPVLLCLALLAGPTGAEAKEKRQVWQDYVVANCNLTAETCVAPVYTVPNRKRLEITNVSCLASVSTAD